MRNFFLLVILLLFTLATSSSVHAQLFGWTGGGSTINWSEPANWGGVAPPAGGASTVDLLFGPGSTNFIPSNNLGTFDLESLFFSGGTSYTLFGNTLRFSDASPILNVFSGNHTVNNFIQIPQPLEIEVGPGDQLDLNGNLSGTANVTKTDPGLLVLDGSNGGWSGDLLIEQGSVRFDPGDALSLNTDVHVAAGATADFSPESEGFGGFSGAGHLEFGNSVDIFSNFTSNNIFNGTISGTNTHWRKQGTGTVRFSLSAVDIDQLTVENGSATIDDGATISVDGGVNVRAVLVVMDTGILNSGGNLNVENGGTFFLSNGTQGSTNIIVQPGGAFRVGTSRTGTISGGSLQVADSADLDLQAGSTLRLQNNAIGLLGDLTESDSYRLDDDTTLAVESGTSLTSNRLFIRESTVMVDGPDSTLQLQDSLVIEPGTSDGSQSVLSITNGGRVSSVDLTIRGPTNNRVSTMVVTGEGSSVGLTGEFNMFSTILPTGSLTASLTIANGASFSSKEFSVRGKDALANISGAGTTMEADVLVVGTPFLLNQPGHFLLEDSAQVTIGSETNISVGSLFELNGGIFTSSSVILDGGQVLIDGGYFVADSVAFSGAGTLEILSGKLSVTHYPTDLEIQGGTLAPRALDNELIGRTDVVGDYMQQSAATLAFDLAGPLAASEHDVVSITGNALLDGELQISLFEYIPNPTDTFTLLGASNILGVFSNVTTGQRLDTLDGSGSFQVNYGVGSAFAPNVLVLSAFQAAADFDGDGDVDGQDFLVWQRGGSPNPLSSGDLALWQTQYGMGAGPSSALVDAVPEPCTDVCLCLSTLLVICTRRFEWR